MSEKLHVIHVCFKKIRRIRNNHNLSDLTELGAKFDLICHVFPLRRRSHFILFSQWKESKLVQYLDQTNANPLLVDIIQVY